MGMHSPKDRTAVLMVLFWLLSYPHLFGHQRQDLALRYRQALLHTDKYYTHHPQIIYSILVGQDFHPDVQTRAGSGVSRLADRRVLHIIGKAAKYN
jgi:hypothetical protein